MSLVSDFKTSWNRASDKDLSVMAAGVAFYAFLSLIPLLTAAILSYGLFADPREVAGDIARIAGQLPQSAADLLENQLRDMVSTSADAKGLALLAALAIALVSARGSATALVRATAVAVGDDARRSFIRANLVSLAVVAGAVIAGGILLTAGSLTGGLARNLGLSSIAQAASFIAMALFAALCSAAFYRKAPPQRALPWKAALAGGFLAAIGIVAATLAFGIYAANFGNYNATYGSLGAVIALLTWLYICAYLLLIGAQFAAVRADPIAA